MIAIKPDKAWYPEELLDFSRKNQKPAGRPGEKYHYSDSGFILLGLIIEKIHSMPLHEVLTQEILKPLEMERTWMPFRSSPARGSAVIRPAWIRGVNVAASPSITADWAGGGIASTEEDLLIFSKALWEGDLLANATREEMLHFDHKFHRAIYYGLGVMEYRIDEISFFLRGFPDIIGHMGILGTLVFYSPDEDLHMIVSVGSDRATVKSVQLMINILGKIIKL